MGSRTRLVVSVLIALCGVPRASAQGLPTGINVQQLRPSWGSGQIFGVDTTQVLEHLQIGVGVWTILADDPLTVRAPGGTERVGSIVSRQLDLAVAVGLGLFDLLDLGVVVPMVPFRTGDTVISGVSIPDVSGFAMGDVRVGTRLRVYGDPRGIFRLGLRLDVGIPTGVGPFASSAKVSFEPVLLLDVRYRRFRSSLNVGFRNLFGSESVGSLKVGPELMYGLALGVELVPGFDAVAEVHGTVGLTVDGAGDALGRLPAAPLEWMAGLRYAHPVGFSGALGAGTGMTQGYGTPDWRVALYLGWTFDPRREQRAASEFTDPSLDPAGEEVTEPDPADPTRVRIRRAPGVTAADQDGDGLADRDDACPADAEDKDAYQDEDGCPDEDNDGDGVPDARDGTADASGFGACRDQPEDVDGHEDQDGCPDEDNDGDGVPDALDECPNVAEDRDGFEDDDGCADDDNDGDGFLDANDGPKEPGTAYGSCRNMPETEGPSDSDRDHPDGCPDAVKVLSECRLEPLRVQFALGSARILPASVRALVTYAKGLSAATWARSIAVEGHTDARGTREANLTLSQKRAEAVRTLLQAQGVPGTRLIAVGRGPDVVPNTTEVPACKAPDSAACGGARRRVEFVIRETDAGKCGK